MNKEISVIGAGYWGKNYLKVLSQLESLHSIFDFSPEIREQYNNQYKLKNFTLEEIFQDEDVEGIVIATPMETHYEIAMQALNAEKNVLIEKPICSNLAQAKELHDLALSKNLVLMVGHLMNYHAHFIKLIEIIKKRDLGKLQLIRSKRKSLGKVRNNENVIWSFAPHDISMINRILPGKHENLKVYKTNYFNSICDKATISYEKEGVIVEIEVDWTAAKKTQSFELYYEKGIIIFEDSLQDNNKKLSILDTKFDYNSLSKKINSNIEYIPVQGLSPLENQCNSFIQSINTKTNPVTDSKEAMEVLELLLLTDEF
tara:strand:- start:503 stop:1447 length:945 start_codon:yes stop_codon:yes gene_type:complete